MRKDGETARMDADAMLAWYEKLIDDYPIASVEDAFAEDDWEAFARFTEAFGRKVTVVGDDLTVTNKERIAQASEKRAVNSVLIKLNQIGTVSETLDAIMLTEKNGWKPFISHRSGETEDTFIADLAVGVSAPYIKAGSLARGERIAKYNRLMEIEGILARVS
jgi:enolase